MTTTTNNAIVAIESTTSTLVAKEFKGTIVEQSSCSDLVRGFFSKDGVFVEVLKGKNVVLDKEIEAAFDHADSFGNCIELDSLDKKEGKTPLTPEGKEAWLVLADILEEKGHSKATAIRSALAGKTYNWIPVYKSDFETVVVDEDANEVLRDEWYPVGGSAVYGSYNLAYFGRIEKVTAKRVFIKEYEHRAKRTSFTYSQFLSYNTADSDRQRERNANWYD